jgi:hypothetical protein
LFEGFWGWCLLERPKDDRGRGIEREPLEMRVEKLISPIPVLKADDMLWI